jgi:hypothetical protein
VFKTDVLAKFFKQPITKDFKDLKSFLEHKQVNAVDILPKIEGAGVALWQLPRIPADKLEKHCEIPWIVADRIQGVASRYDAS